jgi:outer membrane biosynthesis protein TonB
MAAPQSKVLRLGVIQGGKIVEERLVTARQPVTLGTNARNTIVVPLSNLPDSFTAFTVHGDGYQLCFEEGMEGRVQDDHGVADFAALVAQGKARKEGKGHAVPVTDAQRGRLTIGEVTLLWQFVVPPPEAPRPVLPPDARGNRFKSMDRLFGTVLAVSFLTHGGLYAALASADLPPEVTIEQIPDRYARLLVPDRQPVAPVEKKDDTKAAAEEKKVEEKRPEADGKKAEKKAETTEQAAARKAARSAAVAKAVQGKGMLKVLGALGPGSGGGAVADVFGAGGGMTDVATALSGAGGVAMATDPGAGGGRKGGGQGGAASIGDLATSGGGAVAYGSKTEVKVTGTVATEAAEIDSSDIDQGKLSAFVRARMGLIKACYENALKRNPGLKGKVVIRFTILETGGVSDVGASQNTLGAPDVAACIMNTMRTWRTQFRPSGPVSVEYPFLFTPSN